MLQTAPILFIKREESSAAVIHSFIHSVSQSAVEEDDDDDDDTMSTMRTSRRLFFVPQHILLGRQQQQQQQRRLFFSSLLHNFNSNLNKKKNAATRTRTPFHSNRNNNDYTRWLLPATTALPFSTTTATHGQDDTANATTTTTTTTTIAPITTFTEDEQMIQMAVRQWARSTLLPVVRDMDTAAVLSPDILQGLFAQGFMGLEIPVHLAGSALSFTAACLVVEEISRIDPSVAILGKLCCCLYDPQKYIYIYIIVAFSGIHALLYISFILFWKHTHTRTHSIQCNTIHI